MDLSQVAIGRSNQPEVHIDRPGAAETGEGPVLKHLQELNLQRRRHFADLVKEQGAAMGGLKETRLALFAGAREGTALVAEELGFEELGRDRAAIDLDEGPILPGSFGVDQAGDDVLADAGFPLDQQRGVDPRQAQAKINHCLHGGARPSDAIDALAFPAQLSELGTGAVQISLSLAEPLLQGDEFGQVAGVDDDLADVAALVEERDTRRQHALACLGALHRRLSLLGGDNLPGDQVLM
jgi:hypothetical protein